MRVDHLINGRSVAGNGYFETINPATQEVLAEVASGGTAQAQAHAAVAAAKGHGEGFMHDTAMLLGALGWSGYDGCAEIITPYFGASGTGQLNAVFPVTPQSGTLTPAAQASAATGYQAVSRL